MCGAPKTKVSIPHNSISVMQCCLSSPITGLCYQKPSKYCEHHQHLEMEGSDGIDDSSLVVRIPLATPNVQSSLTCDAVGTLPDADSNDILVGCKKANNVNKF